MKRVPIKQINLLFLSAAFCAIPTLVSAQQSTVESLLRECALIDHDRQRLACYDQVLRPRKIEAPVENPSVAETWEATRPQVPAESPPTPAVADKTPVIEDTFGLEKKRIKGTEVRNVTVTGFSKNAAGKYLFSTEDSQVWLQADSRRLRPYVVPFEAQIRSASMGSFFLKPMSSRVSVKVRRIK